MNSMLVRISTKDVAQKAFKDLGVAVYDSSGEMRNMRDILVDLNGAMAGMTQEQKNSYMSAIAGTNYYSQFGYLLDGVKEGVNGSASAWDELAGAIDNSTGALDAMDATATGTLQGALARFQSAISDLKISMVEDFGPYAMQIIDAVALKIPDITAGFSELIQKLPIQEFMNGVGQMAGGVLDFVGKIVDGQSFSEAFSSTLSEDFGVELPGSVQTFLGVIQNLWDDFQSFIGWIGSTAEATLGGLKDTIAEHEPQLQAIMDLLSDVQQKFSEAFGGASDDASSLVSGGLPALVGALLDVLGAAANVLDKFVEWKGFIPTVTTLATAIAGFKLAKTAIEIAKVTKAMTLLRVAKIKDKAETLYLNALYAKDAIVKAASTAATWAQTAATTAWNVVCTAATAVTTALGAAFTFLTSPISLVILAIGAVIAIGVLLYKNWDTVKEKAGQLGEWISAKFSALKDAVCNAVDGFKDKFPVAFEFIKGVFDGWWTTVKGVIDGVKQVFQGIIDFVAGVFTGDWSRALDGLKNIFLGAFNALKSLALAPLNALKGVVTGAFNAIDTATGGKLSAIKDKFTSKMGEVKASVSEAFNNVKDTAGNLMETARANVGAKLDAMKSAYDSAGGGIKGVVAGAMAGVQSTFSSVMSTVDTLTGGKLSSITSAFTNKLNAAQTAVTNVLGNIKQAFSDKLEAAKSVVTGALDKIKGAFNFKWSLPHLNLPHISVSGGQAPYGIAGKGSLPKFSIEWYKNGGIMTQPTAFGINPESGNLMAGGEAGPEAIVPLSQLWEKMTTILKGILAESQNGGAGNALSALVDKVGAAMQGSTQTPISGLLDRLSGGGNEPQPATANGAPINYAPVYNFNGAAPTKDDLVEAERMSQAEFNEMMEQWQRDNDRKRF